MADGRHRTEARQGLATLAAELMRQGMVDELVLIVYPILLGRGLRFFAGDVAPCELSLVSSQATPTGLHFNFATPNDRFQAAIANTRNWSTADAADPQFRTT